MAVVRRPRAYTALALLVLWGVPICFLNIWVLQKGVLAKVLARESLMWMGVASAWVLVTLYWLLKAKWRGFWSLVALSAAVFLVNVFNLVETKNYALAFYALFLLITAGLYGLHLFRSLSEAYYSPGQSWYEGRPPFLPGLEITLRAGESTAAARLSRLGIEGCYAYPTQANALDLDKVDVIALKLGDLTLDCAVELVSRSKDGAGRGFRFLASSADQSKDIRDFIDRVRSSGYVA